MENNQRVVDSCFDRMQARNGLTAKNQSQLGKLIPMLQLGAKNSKDGEAGLASLSDRMSSLRALIDRSREAFRRLPTMGTVSRSGNSSALLMRWPLLNPFVTMVFHRVQLRLSGPLKMS